jgi:hypothetical protein
MAVFYLRAKPVRKREILGSEKDWNGGMAEKWNPGLMD